MNIFYFKNIIQINYQKRYKKCNYPFLKEIWKLYKIDEEPKETDNSKELFSICNKYSIYEREPTDNLKYACRRLLKKFELLHANVITGQKHNEWCNNINNWIYHELNPYILNDDILNNDIINRILIEAQEKFFRHMQNKIYCPYTILNKNHEPQKLNKLRIFNDNTMTFKTILMNKGHDYYCTCINFVNDCIKIYRTFHSQYCLSSTDKKNNNDTCEIVKYFDIYYRGFLFNRYTGIQGILPDLTSTDDININIVKCPLEKKGKGLDSANGEQLVSSASSTAPTEPAGKTVPTAIGTIVGVSSVLGLLYKVISNFYLNM
ncbi:hypothetical protein PVNG_03820 [Plasmodium vivax North Korean]|uniref:Uncharacterized protein n=1 Tax=Plasmodium vivax North Korean TaxID=1035514 RepID=A0A0J9TUG0_PLAVI|nr:hypothetical protein PVNG_03820 [Plasmodium vivax North Korean]